MVVGAEGGYVDGWCYIGERTVIDLFAPLDLRGGGRWGAISPVGGAVDLEERGSTRRSLLFTGK